MNPSVLYSVFVSDYSQQSRMSKHLLSSPSSHLHSLSQAFSSFASQDSTITLATTKGARLCLNKDLLMFYSPLLRSLLSSLPLLTPPLLLLPDTSLASLLALESLLANGECCFASREDVREVAKVLGVTMEGLEMVASTESGNLLNINAANPTYSTALKLSSDKNEEAPSDEDTGINQEYVVSAPTIRVTKDKCPESTSTAPTTGVVSVEVYGEKEPPPITV